jgi:hypothetical protein
MQSIVRQEAASRTAAAGGSTVALPASGTAAAARLVLPPTRPSSTMASPVRRRLRCITAGIVSADSKAGEQDSVNDALLEAAQQLATENRLVPSAFPPEIIRELMVAGGQATAGAKVQRVSGVVTETERRLAVEMPEDIELGAPPQPLLDDEGQVSAEEMDRLCSLEAAAATEGRYEDALYLQRLQRVIDPCKPQLSYDDCAPESPEDAAVRKRIFGHHFILKTESFTPRQARDKHSWEMFGGKQEAFSAGILPGEWLCDRQGGNVPRPAGTGAGRVGALCWWGTAPFCVVHVLN